MRAQGFDLIRAPEFYRESLLNGMQVLFSPGDAPRAPFVLMIKNGAAFDPSGKKGLTQLTADLVTQQEKNRDGLPIRSALQKLGAELSVQVGWDIIYFHGSAPQDRVIEVLNIVGAAIARADFPRPTFDRLREDLVERVRREGESLSILTQNKLWGTLFGPNPYAHPIAGTVETLSSLTLVDVKRQYRKIFLPNQSQLAFIYSGNREEGARGLSQSWGRWIQREPLAFTFRPATLPQEKRIVLLDHPGEEGMFRWGTLSPEANSRDLLPLKVLEQYLILSLPGWARDLTSEDQIRASARMAVHRMPGYLQLSIQARSEQLVPYFKRFTSTLRDLHEGRLDVERFQEAKRLVYVEFRQALDDPEARLYRLLETDLYRWGINYVVYFGLRVDRVTPEVFRKAVSQYLPLDDFVLVMAGRAADLRPSLESLGQIHSVP